MGRHAEANFFREGWPQGETSGQGTAEPGNSVADLQGAPKQIGATGLRGHSDAVVLSFLKAKIFLGLRAVRRAMSRPQGSHLTHTKLAVIKRWHPCENRR